jgi:hypothetical protein
LGYDPFSQTKILTDEVKARIPLLHVFSGTSWYLKHWLVLTTDSNLTPMQAVATGGCEVLSTEKQVR